VIKRNPKAVEDYSSGKGNTFQFLIGQVLAATQGRANPDMVRNVLLERIAREK
jgi:aspartyl-tRNA(Asn)/glutamyl-tRNA(Gln) amidotransferase subunit B